MRTVYIGMGANLPSFAGAPEATLAAAALRLGAVGRVSGRSSLYSTEPVGFQRQPRFVNAVAALETGLTPRELLEALMLIEQEFGRDRRATVANGPRTLDLDILLFGDLVVGSQSLEIPHARLAERAFVLVPLCEIAPGARDPVSGVTMSDSFRRLNLAFPDANHGVVQIESDFWCIGAGETDSAHG